MLGARLPAADLFATKRKITPSIQPSIFTTEYEPTTSNTPATRDSIVASQVPKSQSTTKTLLNDRTMWRSKTIASDIKVKSDQEEKSTNSLGSITFKILKGWQVPAIVIGVLAALLLLAICGTFNMVKR